jgi:hypothetical protein
MNKLKRKTRFTKMDVCWGYNNIQIAKGDKWKATFKMNFGLYELTVMFFGLTNLPATFQNMMDYIFIEQIDKGWLVIYMDDMLVITEDNATLHYGLTKKVLQILRDNDLFLKPEKCTFYASR